MNGYREETIYGVPYSTWASWSSDTKERYLMQYDPDATSDLPAGCFTHGDGRTTCYSEGITDAEMLAYTYTYGVDEWIFKGDHDTAVETGELTNETMEEVKEYYENPSKLYEPFQEPIETGIILAALAGLVLLSRTKK